MQRDYGGYRYSISILNPDGSEKEQQVWQGPWALSEGQLLPEFGIKITKIVRGAEAGSAGIAHAEPVDPRLFRRSGRKSG
jgi:hypothetical protein